MNGNTPFRLWKCVLCGIELDEADGFFPITIDKFDYCEACSKKDKITLSINEYKDAIVAIGVWANQYRKEAEKCETQLATMTKRVKKAEELANAIIRARENVCLMGTFTFTESYQLAKDFLSTPTTECSCQTEEIYDSFCEVHGTQSISTGLVLVRREDLRLLIEYFKRAKPLGQGKIIFPEESKACKHLEAALTNKPMLGE